MNYEQWEIWIAKLDPVIGSEQGKTRPVLIVSRPSVNQRLNSVSVVPLSSLKPGRRIYRNETLIPSGQGGLAKDSIALCHQIRTIDKQRFTMRVGKLHDITLRFGVIEALCHQLSISLWRRT